MKITFREIVEEQMPIKSLVIAIACIVFFAGYGLWTTTDAGTLVVESSVYGTQVFVDDHLGGVLRDTPGSLRLSERAGKHTVIVSRGGYWPWMQDIEIKKHETTSLHPFLVPQKIEMESIPRSVFADGTTNMNPDYTEALSLFENLNTSDEIQPLVDATRIENVLYADYAHARTDVLLIATPDGIFAIGVEKSEHPNFQPVYKGSGLSFVKTTDGTLYIKDGDAILRVTNLRL